MKKETRSLGVYADNLTIILPIKDRSCFTWRWLNSATEAGIACRIIIADGGSDDQIEQKFKNGNPFPELNLTYLRNPPSETDRDFILRIADALDKVETPLVSFGANDDFIFLPGLENAVCHMMNNQDCSSARGAMFRFCVRSNENKEGKFNVYGRPTIIDEFPYLDLPDESEKKNTMYRLSLYYKALSITTWKDIHRTQNQQKIFKILLQFSEIDLWFAHYLFNSLAFVQGENANVPGLHSLIQINPGGSEGAVNITNKNYIDKIFSRIWNENLDKFMDVVAPLAADISTPDIAEAKEELRLAFLYGVIKPRITWESLEDRKFGRYIYSAPTKLNGEVGYKNSIFWRIEDIGERGRRLTKKIYNLLNSYNIFSWKGCPGVLPLGPHSAETKWFRKFMMTRSKGNS